MEVERNENGIKIYSDVDRMLPLISIERMEREAIVP